MGIEADINIAEAVSDMDGVSRKFRRLRSILMEHVDEAVYDVTDEFRAEVKDQIRASAIDADESGELMNSWRIRPLGLAQYQVYSLADHAVYLEVGTRPHDISGNNWLLFEPDNPTAYKGTERTFKEMPDGSIEGDYGHEGLITSKHDPLWQRGYANNVVAKDVRHPGTDPYKYFKAARDARDWSEILNNRIAKAFEQAKREAGFRATA